MENIINHGFIRRIIMGIYETKIKKEEQKNNSWSMKKEDYEMFKKNAEEIYEAFFGDIMRKTEFIEKKG